MPGRRLARPARSMDAEFAAQRHEVRRGQLRQDDQTASAFDKAATRSSPPEPGGWTSRPPSTSCSAAPQDQAAAWAWAAASAAATCCFTPTKLSGVTDMESMPASTRNRAKSG